MFYEERVMAVFKCKMCGGELDVREGMSVAECPYCGTKQTLPRLDNDKKINLYDRADHFRRNNEYDKAADIYEKVLEEDREDAEAYWSLMLCRYGVEYVEDPTNHKRVPTINRAQYTSVFLDEDYLKAIEYADGYQRDVYEEEAKQIDDIQKGILEISNKEDPFDVFICYKETDEQGRRTHDSVYAQDIYNNLTNEGYKVFFSRITLEDKLGTAYEPYIFAALNSAKVMIVIGTSSDNFNAVWVKNEWSRYLALVKKGEDKTIIPVYKDIDPYDLPDEFAYLQAQDMSKVGFMQDLIRNIKKLVSDDVIDERQKKGTSSVIVDTMMRRASTALSNSEWDTASRCYDNVLDYDSKNIDAYLGKLMTECRTNVLEGLKNYNLPLDNNKYFKSAITLADEDLKKKLEYYNSEILRRIKKKQRRKRAIISIVSICVALIIIGVIINVQVLKPLNIYNSAIEMKNNNEFDSAIETFESLGDFKDSIEQRDETIFKKCQFLISDHEYAKAVNTLSLLESDNKNELIYQIALQLYKKKEYQSSLLAFNKISVKYKDVDSYRAKLIDIVNSEQNKEKYNLALTHLKNKEYSEAIEAFEELGDFSNSKDKLLEAKYLYCRGYINNDIDNLDKDPEAYLKELSQINYKDSKKLYSDYLTPTVDLIFNESEADAINNSSVVSNPFIMHFQISSFHEDLTDVIYKCKITYPDGSTKTSNISTDQSLNILSPSGELKAEIYDDSGTLLGSKTVTVL